MLLSLEKDPRPFGSKKLRETDYYRPGGGYRIVYSVDDKAKLVKSLSVGNRKEIYRSL
jgi:mRNA-degrading endonuclease RelE of RelBE toxin-antitoxin system